MSHRASRYRLHPRIYRWRARRPLLRKSLKCEPIPKRFEAMARACSDVGEYKRLLRLCKIEARGNDGDK